MKESKLRKATFSLVGCCLLWFVRIALDKIPSESNQVLANSPARCFEQGRVCMWSRACVHVEECAVACSYNFADLLSMIFHPSGDKFMSFENHRFRDSKK